MSTSRSTTAVSSPVTCAIAVARLVVRKVLPDPPLDENTEMTCPRRTWPPSDCEPTLPSAGCRPTMTARSTASRSSSVPWVMSTTSRMPARIAAGSSPFHVWSRTSDDRGARRGPPDELGQAERVGLLHFRRQHEHVDRGVGVDQQLLGGRGRLHPADLVRLELERSSDLLPERLRRPDGDDARFGHLLTPMTFPSGTPIGARLRVALVVVRRQQADVERRVLRREDELLRVLRRHVQDVGRRTDWRRDHWSCRPAGSARTAPRRRAPARP